MPFYPDAVAAGLEDHVEDIRNYAEENDDTVRKYRDILRTATGEDDADAVRERVSKQRYPGAVPTEEFDGHEDPIVQFDTASTWDSHEAVNEWAEEILEGVTTIAADGSSVGPVQEFTVPLGLVQVAWCANRHSHDADYEEAVHTRILGPEDVTYEGSEPGQRYADEQAPNHERYEAEGATVVECIERHADLEPPPVVLYDGPLVPSFANTFEEPTRQRYLETMTEVLAASEHHEVPVVGYTAATGATNLAKLLQWGYEGLRDEPFVADARILEGFTHNWGDRSLLFLNRQDGAVDALEGSYDGEQYAFGTEMLFAYLNASGPGAMDRVELPRWIAREGLTDYVFDVVRAEAAIGRGYPELLQQADTNAVLSAQDRREFMQLVQRFADEHDLSIEWDVKSLSKERRRR
jgi:hypothetical protein